MDMLSHLMSLATSLVKSFDVIRKFHQYFSNLLDDFGHTCEIYGFVMVCP